MKLKSTIALAFLITHPAFAEDIKHLPQAPSWNYLVKGDVAAGPVGTDYCNMDNGEVCMGTNVLLTGQAALVIFNQLPGGRSTTFRKNSGIECSKDIATGTAKCLFHVTDTGIGAGETPWISD